MKTHKRSKNKRNRHNVFRNKISEIVICMLICLTVCACGQNATSRENTAFTEDAKDADTQRADVNAAANTAQENLDKDSSDMESADAGSADENITENTSADGQKAIEENQTPARRIEVVPASKANIFKREEEGGREITDEEIQYFSEFVQKDHHYGFLMSAYDTPADVNLNEVCYNGFGSSWDEISEEEIEAYKKTVEWGEIYTDFFRITTTQLDEFLLETTGLSYEQMNHPLSWIYIPEYDAYYSDHGDINYESFSCIGGYTADEKFFVLRMRRDFIGFPEDYYLDGYHRMDYELVLEKCSDTYQFRSNRMLLEDRLIEEQSFDVNLSPIGEVTFVSYEPDVERVPLADVSFSIIKDGWEISQLGGVFNGNIRGANKFHKIEAIAFADYDEDGITDIIIILDYSLVSGLSAGEIYSEVRIYKGEYEEYSAGDYYYTQRYQSELSETLTAEFLEPTIRGVLDYIAIIS